MLKKTPISVFIFALILGVAGTQIVTLGVANPVLEEKWVDPPVISVHSPINGTLIDSVLLNITVTQPESWLSTPVSFGYETGGGVAQNFSSVSYYVDGKLYGSVDANNSFPFNYFVYLTDLGDGNHRILIRANATGVVRDWVSDSVYSVPIESSVIVDFAFENKDNQPSTLASSAPEFPALVALSCVVIAIVLVVIVIRKKRKVSFSSNSKETSARLRNTY